MFSKEIIGSDSFLDLPVSSRELYFQLGMYADDDGFVTPKKIIRMVGASSDDIKVLKSKGLIIPFVSGVIVIRHWRENNLIRQDRYQPTVYQQELKLALGDEVYSGVHLVNQRLTQYSIGKDSIGEERGFSSSKKLKPSFRGMDMRQQGGKWFCLPKDGGEWLEFAGKLSDIQWK